jgi:CBS domain-containing protein
MRVGMGQRFNGPTDYHASVANGRLPRDDVVGRNVGDVMIANPKTLPTDVLVDDVRRLLQSTSIRTVLLTENDIFRGAIERDTLPADAPDDAPARSYADPQPRAATPAMPMPDAIELLERRREPRLIVLDEDGATLRGLLCLHRGSDGFCVG